MAHKWPRWLHNPCHRGGSPPLQSGGQNQKWPRNGQGGCITPAAWGVPTALEQGAESEVAHKWAGWLHNPCLGGPHRFRRGAESEVAHRWLHNPCRLGGPHRFRAGGGIRGGPQVGKVADITPAAWGVPTASERGAESEVAHKWARWRNNPCCLRGPHRFRAGGGIRGGPQVGKVAE